MARRFSVRVETLLDRLRRWTRNHGPISDSALRRTIEGLSILNGLAAARRAGEFPGDRSPLEEACVHAGLVVARRQQSYTVEETIALLAARARHGLPCSPKVLEQDPEWCRRYASIRRYHDWEQTIVVPVLRSLSPPEPRQFFERFPDLRWHLVHLTGDVTALDAAPDDTLDDEAFIERAAIVLGAFRARFFPHLEGGQWPTRDRFMKHPEGAALHSFLENARRSPGRTIQKPYEAAVTKLNGKAPRLAKPSGARIHIVSSHDRHRGTDGAPVSHPALREPRPAWLGKPAREARRSRRQANLNFERKLHRARTRAQHRVCILLDEPHFAELVGGQWLRLIEANLVHRFDTLERVVLAAASR